jgi:FtsP/CotA-like multicopper oxidase with cupredoxin domain
MSVRFSRRRGGKTTGGLAAALLVVFSFALPAAAECPEGQAPAFEGSDTCILDPESIPKYVLPLVIPPVMNNDGDADSYDIAVRQFKQQILPGGHWNFVTGRNDSLPATTVWSYGPAADEAPDSSGIPGGAAGLAPAPNSQFNYPAYTFETYSNTAVDVRWINDLVDENGNCLEHLLPIDQTLHWANPPMECRHGPARTDCGGLSAEPYTGPVPIVTHVHGAHVDGHSDGYPEAWWLPVCDDMPEGYATSGTIFDDSTGTNAGDTGYADYSYRQDQPATTLWYHDHTLGMTRSNVYAGPAGFWLIRGRPGMEAADYDVIVRSNNPGRPAKLPGPAPVAGQGVLELNIPGDPVRNSIREIPIVIQDRTFNPDGSLFYPGDRAFFEGLNPAGGTEPVLDIDFIGDPPNDPPEELSDIAPIWNPEAFFNVMVVNGVAWPKLEVAPARYRFRLLNGCNSRFLNLALTYTHPDNGPSELPFIQIGAEQGFLPYPVEVLTGFATQITDGKRPRMQDRTPAASAQQALLMTLAERADVIVDFSGLPDGTVITMINTAPDAPFGGFPDPDDPEADPPADPATTGQVMQFVVNSELWLPSDGETTNPYKLLPLAEPALGDPVVTRQVSLNEGESERVCVEDVNGSLFQVEGATPEAGCPEGSEPFAPKEALLGLVDPMTGEGIPLKWTDPSDNSFPVTVTLESGKNVEVRVSENPIVGDTENWEIYNFTEDAHPIHLHLVRFEVIERRAIPGFDPVAPVVQPWETGYKDTVIAYPGEITTVKAEFDIEGLYVWHCHIVEHEDNEMMRPYVVSAAPEE